MHLNDLKDRIKETVKDLYLDDGLFIEQIRINSGKP